MPELPQVSRTAAAQRFHHARRQAAIETVLARLTGKSADLWSFDQIVDQLGMAGQTAAGLQEIPLSAIVGSVGRYHDFTRTFLPRSPSDEDRWVSIQVAGNHFGDLPPIDVYQIGETYFVKDGNHRVSVARQMGLETINATVTAVQTRVDLPPDAKPDDLIIASEYMNFLEKTRLDQLRQPLDMRVSVPGQYRSLVSQIQAHAKFCETCYDRGIGDDEAVTRWYDEVYIPLIEAIREQGILRYFPGRTETDFFIWLSRRRNELQKKLGWEISPEVTVSRLAANVAPQTAESSVRGRLSQGLSRLAHPLESPNRPPERWSEERILARYTDRLFGDILLPFSESGLSHDRPSSAKVLEFAVALAIEEHARLHVLCVLESDSKNILDSNIAQLQSGIEARKIAIDLSVEMYVEQGNIVEVIGKHALLNDVIVVDRRFGLAENDRPPSRSLLRVLRSAHRPVFIVGGSADRPITGRTLLIYDGTPECEEALFVGTYLAEAWHIELDILLIGDARHVGERQKHVEDYLELHEVEAAVIPVSNEIGDYAGRTLYEAESRGCDLLLIPGPRRGRRPGSRYDHTVLVGDVLRKWPHSVLITT